ncbi:hypothetical protein JB92DRAFT_3017367 [Gautieria morchelliformis]|nr:hypothetical protein JB92DRAFT_3017367 [Gautieria morchelliformis]
MNSILSAWVGLCFICSVVHLTISRASRCRAQSRKTLRFLRDKFSYLSCGEELVQPLALPSGSLVTPFKWSGFVHDPRDDRKDWKLSVLLVGPVHIFRH